ncbi:MULTISPECIES: cytochrome b5 domain-containing protein [Kocuria]|uniref:cytochrome b5 domain-containing protein n=1 Tax=Kocuria TaxID=57493 RepID=UPI001300B0C0|nr:MULTISPECIES: cytochrome b5 domain-containing protein [Kocuria]
MPLESNVFSTVGDLPLHPLVVHFAVVLLPLAALVLLLAAFIPAVRRRFLGLAVIVAFVGVVATFVSKESGEALAGVVGEPETHAQWADWLMVVSAIFFGMAALWLFLSKRADAGERNPQTHRGPGRGAATVVGFITALLSVAVIVLSVLTGHSGAQAAWGGTMGASATSATSSQNSDDDEGEESGQESDEGAEGAAAGDAASATSTTASGETYSLATVQEHSTESDCWAAVDNNVYDLTDWVAQHPGGQRAITQLCGTDATDAFAGQHGNNDEAKAALSEHQIGTLQN